jgi:hypothetical protein
LNGQTYTASGTYSQILTNAAGCDSLLTLNLTLDFTGLDENAIASLSVYPNPAQDVIFLDVDPNLIGSNVMICDALGRIIYETTLQEEEMKLDLGRFPSGTYLMKVGSHTERLEILR